MLALPAVTPVTMPVDEPTVAMPVAALVHVPAGVLLSIVVRPTQTEATPPMALGIALTVTFLTAKHPDGNVYVMLTVLAAMPVTTPEAFTVAIAPDAVVQAPAGVLLSVVVAATQTLATPVIAVGLAFIVTVTVLVQPLVPKHVIVAMPAPMPVTVPDEEPTVATETLELDHVEPIMDEPNVVFAPTHIVVGPVIEIIGAGETVATPVAMQPDTGSVYVMVAVPPATLTPVSTPDELTDANVASLLLHVPPRIGWVSRDV